MTRERSSVMLAAVVLVAIALVLLPLPALASGKVLSASLLFLPEVSNWGPTGATGEASVSVVDGTVKITARGLTALSTDVYEAWLVTAGLSSWVSVGRFSGTGGAVDYSVAVDEIPDLDYNYIVITVEPAEGDSGEPSGRNAIAGYFGGSGASVAATAAVVESTAVPVTELAVADVVAEAVAPAPVYLPVSGAPLRVSASVIVVGLVGVVLGSLVLTQRR